MVKILSFILLFAPLVFCGFHAYSGVRVIKSYSSMLRDSFSFYRNISKKIINAKLSDIVESQGDWWTRVTLKYIDLIAGAFDFSPKRFKHVSSKMLPTGTFESKLTGDALYWDIKFDWAFTWTIFNIEYTCRIMIESKDITFSQSFLYGRPYTNIFVNWNASSIRLGGVGINFIKDWLYISIEKMLYPRLAMILNTNLNPIIDNLLAPYENITIKTKNNTDTIITNRIRSAYNVSVYNGSIDIPSSKPRKDYVVMDYETEFTSKNAYKKMETSVQGDFDAPKIDFDYGICYSKDIFIAYSDFLVKAGLPVYNPVNKDDYPRRVGYYKNIVRGLGARYPDDEYVDMIFKGDPKRNYVRLGDSTFLIPIITEFRTVSDNKLFLTFKSTYKADCGLTEDKDHAVRGTFRNVRIENLETIPRIEYEVIITVIALANSMSAIINEYVITNPSGISMGTVRAGFYKFITSEKHIDEICLYYADTQRTMGE